MAIKTCLMVGGGGMAGGWIKRMTDSFSDRIKVIGLADVNQEVLDNQAHALGLSKDQLFTSHEDAMASVKADFNCREYFPVRAFDRIVSRDEA